MEGWSAPVHLDHFSKSNQPFWNWGLSCGKMFVRKMLFFFIIVIARFIWSGYTVCTYTKIHIDKYNWIGRDKVPKDLAKHWCGVSSSNNGNPSDQGGFGNLWLFLYLLVHPYFSNLYNHIYETCTTISLKWIVSLAFGIWEYTSHDMRTWLSKREISNVWHKL